jgi:16S rRNA processing protein RimM
LSNDVESFALDQGPAEVTVARVVKTQGRRGEVAAEILTDFPERFEKLKEVQLVKPEGSRQQRSIESFWFHKNFVVLKFSGFATITEAEALIGAEVRIPRNEAVALPRSRHYVFELVGCQVVDDASGCEFGRVNEVLGAGGNTVLAVKSDQGELLVPFAQEICRSIDVQRREIRVRLPEGLLDLNS